jgi:hypothetical protein
MLRGNAFFNEGLRFVRFRALNDDYTRIKGGLDSKGNYDGLQKDGSYNSGTGNGRIIGGTGPFDFSNAVVPAAIPLKIKFDSGAEEITNIDITPAVDLTMVTVDELVTAINIAAPTDMLASKEAVTLRLLLVYNGTDDPDYIQTYGDFAELARIGQGKGQQFIVSDTFKSFAESPTKKDDETISIEPATGASVDVIIDGYKKGITIKSVETQVNYWLDSLIENGYIDANGAYHDPDQNASKCYFEIEVFNPVYNQGPNKLAQISYWEMTIYLTCSGSVSERTKDKSIMPMNYDIVGTNYTDSKGVETGAVIRKRLDVSEFNALNVYNV